MPARVSPYPDWPLGLWRALNSDNLFIFHTGSFIAVHGRLIEVVRLTKVVWERAPSHHCISLETHFDCWGMTKPQSVLMLFRLSMYLSSFCYWQMVRMIRDSEAFAAQLGCTVVLIEDRFLSCEYCNQFCRITSWESLD